MTKGARPGRGGGRAPGLVLCLAGLWLLGGVVQGCALRYTVPPELTKRLPKSSRKSVFQARTVVTIAIDNRASVRRKMSSTRREIERTRERINEAEARRRRTIATEKGKLDAEVEMLEAKIDFLEERLDFLDDKLDLAKEELLLAAERFELAKAKLVKKHSIAFSGDVEDFEAQVKSLEEDVEEQRADFKLREEELKVEEAKWLEVKTRYYATIGETSRGWWTEQETGGATAEKKVGKLEGKAETEGAEGEEAEPERAVTKVLRKRAGLVLNDWRVAAKIGNTFGFLLAEEELDMSLLHLGLELEGCYFVHPNFPLVLQFAPAIGQAKRSGNDIDAAGNEIDNAEKDERLTVLPLTLGMRYQDNEGTALPFLGIGVGILAVKGDRGTDWGVTFYAKLTFGLDIKLGQTWSLVLEGGGVYGQVQLNHLRETDIGPVEERKTFNLVGGIASIGVVARF